MFLLVSALNASGRRRAGLYFHSGTAEFLPPTPSFRRTRADLGKFQNCVSNFSGNVFEPYGKDTQ